jgi:hypothetical protein
MARSHIVTAMAILAASPDLRATASIHIFGETGFGLFGITLQGWIWSIRQVPNKKGSQSPPLEHCYY